MALITVSKALTPIAKVTKKVTADARPQRLSRNATSLAPRNPVMLSKGAYTIISGRTTRPSNKYWKVVLEEVKRTYVGSNSTI